MADKLTESTWTGFTKKQKLDLDDGALLKALAKLDKTGDDQLERRLDALKEVVEQVRKQVMGLAKRKKELGDKPFGLAKDKLGELLDLAESQQKETQDAITEAAAAAEEEADTPALLTTKMVPLIRELRKGEARMHALVCTAGRSTSVLIMRRAISPSRRKLLAEAVDAKGGAKYFPADCLYEDKVLTFVMKTQAAGMAKRLRQALLDQTELRLKVKVRGEDGVEDVDGEDAGEEQAGVKPAAPPSPAARAAAAAGAAPGAAAVSPEQRAYEKRLPEVEASLVQALRGQHPEATKLRGLMTFAQEKVEQNKDYAAALRAFDALDKLLVKPAGPYARMKDRLSVQLDSARKRNPDLAGRIGAGIAAADALSKDGDDAAAIARLRTLVADVEAELEADRREVELRMDALYEKATRIRLELNPDADDVRASVRKLVKAWDLAAAQAALGAFEKAINKARPIDFEDIDVIEKRRAQEFRKENGKFARNTEQALMAARRIVDDKGNLVLDGGPLKGLPFVRTDDLAAVAEELAATGDASLPQSVHALQMLQRLQKDKGAQAALQRVAAPPDPATAANEDDRQSLRAAQALIRNTLGLPDDAKITDVEARRAAMSALLAQVRQVDVGSCFATASAVRVQRNNPEQFLADMTQMFSTGKLTRVIGAPPGPQKTIEVPISRDMVGRKVDVGRKDSKLHLKPGMIAGLDALGVDEQDHQKVIDAAARRLRAERAVAKALDKVKGFLPAGTTVDQLSQRALNDLVANPSKSIETALNAVLAGVALSNVAWQSTTRKKLATDCAKDFDDVNGSDDFTPQELIEQIAKTRPSGALPPERVAAAKAAYDTSQDNTLTRAWEYTLASMAEQHPDVAYVPQTMTGGIGDAGKAAFNAMAERAITTRGLAAGDADIERAIADNVATDLNDRLQKELKVRYDPEVTSRSGAKAGDGSSSKGGWSLFFRGKKIDGQADFETMVKTLLDEVEQKFDLNALNWDRKYVDRAKEMARKLKEQAETKGFRDSVVESLAKRTAGVDPSHPDYGTKVDEAKDKFNQPWTYEKSGWEYAVMQLCENRPTEPPSRKVAGFTYKDGNVDKTVTDAEGLTHFVLDTLSKIAGRMPDGEAGAGANVPVANTAHAFALTPGSTSLATVLKQGKKPAEVVMDLKEVEGAKNRKRRAAEVPIEDPSKGLVAEMITGAVSIFPDNERASVIAAMQARVRALGTKTASVTALNALLKTVARATLDANYSGLAEADRESWAVKAAGTSAGCVLVGIIPKEEYEAMIDAGMRKLSVPDASRETVRTEVLAAVKQEAAVREDFSKAIRVAMRKLGLGGGDDDLALARKAYDALKTDDERIAALKAAGKTVASPAATFDKLKDDEAAALREHGVCERLDAKLQKALVEPRGLVFADTNWGDGDHMTHFSMVVNPLSDPPAIEMWQMNEDGSAPSPMGEDWIKGSNWRIYDNPKEYGGTVGAHEVTTRGGAKMQWEAYRAELQAKLDDCVAARKGDAAKLRRILDVADARFAEADFAAADTALQKLDEAVAPFERMAGVIAKAVRALESVAGEVDKEVAQRRQAAKERKAKLPTPEMKEAFAASEVLGGLIRELRTGVQSPEALAKFVADHRDVLDYIDTQSPLGAANVVQSLTL